MYIEDVFIVVSTVQSYGDMKKLPRRIDNLEIIANFAAHNR